MDTDAQNLEYMRQKVKKLSFSDLSLNIKNDELIENDNSAENRGDDSSNIMLEQRTI